ncbi:MAG: hypothetical protein ACOYW4_04095 [Bacillota bacterium]
MITNPRPVYRWGTGVHPCHRQDAQSGYTYSDGLRGGYDRFSKDGFCQGGGNGTYGQHAGNACQNACKDAARGHQPDHNFTTKRGREDGGENAGGQLYDGGSTDGQSEHAYHYSESYKPSAYSGNGENRRTGKQHSSAGAIQTGPQCIRAKVREIVAEAVADVIVTRRFAFPAGVSRVDREVLEPGVVETRLYDGIVVLDGTMKSMIYFVSASGAVIQQTVDVPFTASCSIPEARPGLAVELEKPKTGYTFKQISSSQNDTVFDNEIFMRIPVLLVKDATVTLPIVV